MARQMMRRERQQRRKERRKRIAAGVAAALFGLWLFGAALWGIRTVDRSITWLTGRETALQRILPGNDKR